ncbi:MAG: hypothetical protein K0Q72_1232 [Armatimonadetes bacterium]|jgi:hypothetical protein|nr:hypothetical protein [Armatimonadota bacterium]
MGSNKLTHVHVYLIGAVVMVIVGVALFFLLLKPLNEQNTLLAQSIATTEGTSVDVDGKSYKYNQLDDAQKALAEAKARKAGKEAQLASLEKKKQLPSNQALRIAATQPEILSDTMRRWLMLPERVVNTMENWAQTRAKRYGVTVETTFATKAPSTDPTQIPTQIVAWNLGTMTVTGTFPQVMAWAKDWNNAPLLVAVNDLKCSIADRGGKVKATSSLNVYLFPTGPGAGAAVAVAGPAGGGMAPGGGMGNMPGGGMSNMPGSAGPPGTNGP